MKSRSGISSLVFTAHDVQLVIDFIDKSLYDFHSKTFAIVKLEIGWQPGAVVFDRYEVIRRRRRFKSNDNPAIAVFSRVGD